MPRTLQLARKYTGGLPFSPRPIPPYTRVTVELCKVAREGDLPKLQALLSAGADVDATGADGCTALHSASGKDHDSCVQALLTARAALDAVTKRGSSYSRWCIEAGTTALHLVARRGHASCVRTLQEAEVSGRS